MTQQEQVLFDQSLDSAFTWIKLVQEQLKQNDNTQGPRKDLEARVRATEKICESEEEGRMKVDLVVAAAESFLRTCSEEERVHVYTKLKELKAVWEETSTYITHCHSRVEWVWLHWGEYLKAYEELWAWLLRLRLALAPELELQLGLQEKLWQLEHHRVLLEDTQHHASHLERLMEEAEALHVRTEDESVGPEARRDLEEAYNDILQQAKKRVSLLERIVEEQRAYDNLAEDLRSWLSSQTERVNQCLEAEDSTENRLKKLQALYDSVSSREEAFCRIESVAIVVKNGSSPGGAERIAEETEALRGAWERLKEQLKGEQEALREIRRDQEAWVSLSEQLEIEVARLRAQTQKFGQELDRNGEEDLLVAWKRAADILSAMATEEPSVEELKAELKKLFRYSHDTTSLSDQVLACMKEFQGVKSRAFRLCAEREDSLTKRLRDLLQDHNCWNQMAAKMLEVLLEPAESRNITLVLENVEKLLQHRNHLQERQKNLPLGEDTLHRLYDPEKAQSLLKELCAVFMTREELYAKLQQRKINLQGMLSNVDQFNKVYESISNHLDSLRERLTSIGALQPDLQAKQNQNNQLKVVLAELEATQTDLSSLELLASENPGYKKRFNLLYAEWKNLLNSAKVKLNESSENVAGHEEFSRSVLDLEGWMAMQERPTVMMADLLEREMQLHQTEAQGQRVMARTSKEGQVQILQALHRLKQQWNSIDTLCTQIHSHPQLVEEDCSPSEMVSSADRFKHKAEHVETTCGSLAGLNQSGSSGSVVRRRLEPRGGTGGLLSTVMSLEAQLASDTVDSVKGSGHAQSSGSSCKHREAFEAWLKRGNAQLSKVSSFKEPLSTEKLQTRQKKLQELRADLPQGHDLFQRMTSAGIEDQALEDLRYHWMLYRTKLQDCGDLQTTPELKGKPAPKQEVLEVRKHQKSSSFLQRVCCAALPLQLLLLSLLLLAFLLPLTEESTSCSLANNFARSFKVMLRHEGMPPT